MARTVKTPYERAVEAVDVARNAVLRQQGKVKVAHDAWREQQALVPPLQERLAYLMKDPALGEDRAALLEQARAEGLLPAEAVELEA